MEVERRNSSPYSPDPFAEAHYVYQYALNAHDNKALINNINKNFKKVFFNKKLTNTNYDGSIVAIVENSTYPNNIIIAKNIKHVKDIINNQANLDNRNHSLTILDFVIIEYLQSITIKRKINDYKIDYTRGIIQFNILL